jgi:hypothetical protein
MPKAIRSLRISSATGFSVNFRVLLLERAILTKSPGENVPGADIEALYVKELKEGSKSNPLNPMASYLHTE